MLELRPHCENCGASLPPDSTEAMICSFECTFCRTCVDDVLHNVCPNCAGAFAPRPARALIHEPSRTSGFQSAAIAAKRRFRTADVFTDRRYGGNPVAVVLDADGLTGADMQAIACEFNYSETTFVLTPQDRRHTAQVRIFTPRAELPFAGHPNIGTAFLLADEPRFAAAAARGEFHFEELAGVVTVRLLREGAIVTGAEVEPPEHLSARSIVAPESAARCLSLSPTDIVVARHPARVVSVGLPFLVVQVGSRDALRRARPDIEAHRAVMPLDGADSLFAYAEQDDFTQAQLVRDQLAQAQLAQAQLAQAQLAKAKLAQEQLAQEQLARAHPAPLASAYEPQPAVLHARMFAPLAGIPEDPATGSAAAALAAFLSTLAPHRSTQSWHINQGVDMGRPSLLMARATLCEAGRRTVQVGGLCVRIMAGTL